MEHSSWLHETAATNGSGGWSLLQIRQSMAPRRVRMAGQSSSHVHAAVYVKDVTGDVRGFIGGEEADGVGDLLLGA